eukprot:CAMPEP_0196999844 /NCGR_PEP_ID=MMETSP1380-20130617/4935_1 /TAXON_ID=5936 /ORGANISM="Euplotes crassus, Strain CT5" /LENGTH=177 /DNA_ID=CAMNT_0042416915 /DNA_START=89 /DNA_END=622 /DNA_ORIENTATION=+
MSQTRTLTLDIDFLDMNANPALKYSISKLRSPIILPVPLNALSNAVRRESTQRERSEGGLNEDLDIKTPLHLNNVEESRQSSPKEPEEEKPSEDGKAPQKKIDMETHSFTSKTESKTPREKRSDKKRRSNKVVLSDEQMMEEKEKLKKQYDNPPDSDSFEIIYEKAKRKNKVKRSFK